MLAPQAPAKARQPEAGSPGADVRTSPRLQGHENPDCVIPGCASTMESTGRLVHRDIPLWGWFMEFRCPEHGPQLTQGGRWQPLIEAALREVGEGSGLGGLDLGSVAPGTVAAEKAASLDSGAQADMAKPAAAAEANDSDPTVGLSPPAPERV